MGKRRKLIDTMFKLRLFDAVNMRAQLTVLTYHRIAARGAPCQFDRSVFGPTAEAFDQQMKWLAKYADPVGEADVISALRGKLKLPRRSVLVTFDDAYRDQFTVALPMLKTHGIPAIFFVTPGMIDESTLGFWDQIAYAVNRTAEQVLHISNKTFDLSDRTAATFAITKWVKSQPGNETFALTNEICERLKVFPAEKQIQAAELMTWSEIREIAQDKDACGFSIGGHGLTHRLLGSLSRDDQEMELRTSKTLLEDKIGFPVKSVAWPAGSFNDETSTIARRLGYEALFSFESGFNKRTALDPHEIKRIPAGNTAALIACATSFPWVLGATYYP